MEPRRPAPERRPPWVRRWRRVRRANGQRVSSVLRNSGDAAGGCFDDAPTWLAGFRPNSFLLCPQSPGDRATRGDRPRSVRDLAGIESGAQATQVPRRLKMKRYVAAVVMLCAVSLGVLAAETGKPTGSGDDPVIQADRALGAAFAKGDT